jgi:hypothetical protein
MVFSFYETHFHTVPEGIVALTCGKAAPKFTHSFAHSAGSVGRCDF